MTARQEHQIASYYRPINYVSVCFYVLHSIIVLNIRFPQNTYSQNTTNHMFS